jgi:hypothetical protein
MTSLIAHRPTSPYSHTQPGKIIYFSSKSFLVIPSSFFIFSFFFPFFRLFFFFFCFVCTLELGPNHVKHIMWLIRLQLELRSISGCIAFPLTFLIPPRAAKVISYFLSMYLYIYIYLHVRQQDLLWSLWFKHNLCVAFIPIYLLQQNIW